MASTGIPVFLHGHDDLGVYIRFDVDGEVYSDTAILKTAYWFTDHYYLFIVQRQKDKQYQIEIRPKGEEVTFDILKKAYGDFHNYLLDQELRQKVIQETAAVRNILIEKAFFEAKAQLPETTASVEAHIPSQTESYIDDPVHIERVLP